MSSASASEFKTPDIGRFLIRWYKEASLLLDDCGGWTLLNCTGAAATPRADSLATSSKFNKEEEADEELFAPSIVPSSWVADVLLPSVFWLGIKLLVLLLLELPVLDVVDDLLDGGTSFVFAERSCEVRWMCDDRVMGAVERLDDDVDEEEVVILAGLLLICMLFEFVVLWDVLEEVDDDDDDEGVEDWFVLESFFDIL